MPVLWGQEMSSSPACVYKAAWHDTHLYLPLPCCLLCRYTDVTICDTVSSSTSNWWLFRQVSDEGGGIPRSGLPKIWTYLYSTALSPLDDMEDTGEADGPAVLAGYGYGLPLSRLYARYFGGDLQIISMEGYGTDAYLHLNRLGNVQEPLP